LAAISPQVTVSDRNSMAARAAAVPPTVRAAPQATHTRTPPDDDPADDAVVLIDDSDVRRGSHMPDIARTRTAETAPRKRLHPKFFSLQVLSLGSLSRHG
jgi:hypothetical protein